MLVVFLRSWESNSIMTWVCPCLDIHNHTDYNAIGVGTEEVGEAMTSSILETCHTPLLNCHSLHVPSTRVLPIIVLGKANVMDCCSTVTFPDSYKEMFALITEVNSNKTPFMTTAIRPPQFLDASYATECWGKYNNGTSIYYTYQGHFNTTSEILRMTRLHVTLYKFKRGFWYFLSFLSCLI